MIVTGQERVLAQLKLKVPSQDSLRFATPLPLHHTVAASSMALRLHHSHSLLSLYSAECEIEGTNCFQISRGIPMNIGDQVRQFYFTKIMWPNLDRSSLKCEEIIQTLRSGFLKRLRFEVVVPCSAYCVSLLFFFICLMECWDVMRGTGQDGQTVHLQNGALSGGNFFYFSKGNLLNIINY